MDPMNKVLSLPMLLPIAAVATTGPPAGYRHLTTPATETPYTNPSTHPTYTVPSSAKVGDEKIRPPVWNVQLTVTLLTGPDDALRPACDRPFLNMENGTGDNPWVTFGGYRSSDVNESSTNPLAEADASRAAQCGTYVSNNTAFSVLYATWPSLKNRSQSLKHAPVPGTHSYGQIDSRRPSSVHRSAQTLGSVSEHASAGSWPVAKDRMVTKHKHKNHATHRRGPIVPRRDTYNGVPLVYEFRLVVFRFSVARFLTFARGSNSKFTSVWRSPNSTFFPRSPIFSPPPPPLSLSSSPRTRLSTAADPSSTA